MAVNVIVLKVFNTIMSFDSKAFVVTLVLLPIMVIISTIVAKLFLGFLSNPIIAVCVCTIIQMNIIYKLVAKLFSKYNT